MWFLPLTPAADSDRRELLAAIRRLAIAGIAAVLAYAVSELVSEGLSSVALAYYFAVAALLSLAFLPRQLLLPRVGGFVLAGDTALTLLVILRLALDDAGPSGTSLILSLKMMVTALFLPWPIRMQLIASGTTVVFVWLALAARVAGGGSFVLHQWAGPVVAALVSGLGGANLKRARRRLSAQRARAVQSESQLRVLVDHNPDGVIVVGDGKVVFANHRLAVMLGQRSPQLLVGRYLTDLVAAADRSRLSAYVAQHNSRVDRLAFGPTAPAAPVPSAASDPALPVTLLRSDGESLAASVLGGPVIYHGRPAVQLTIRDISRIHQTQTLLECEREILEGITLDVPLTDSLRSLCLLVETLMPGALCSILLLDASRNRLRHGAAPSLPASFVEALGGIPIAEGAGACGTAAFRRAPVVVIDTGIDPLMQAYRDLLQQYRLAACWSVPLLSADGEVLGTFAIYRQQTGQPTSDEQWILRRASNLASLAVHHARARQIEREHAVVFESLARVARELISSLNRQEILDRLCRVTADEMGADTSHVYMLDEATHTYSAVAGSGDSAEQWETVRVVRLHADQLVGILSALREAEVVQIAPGLNQKLLPPGLLSNFGIKVTLFIGLFRGTDIMGVLTVSHRESHPTFAPMLERIARGIGQFAALALENARLVEELERADHIKSDFVATMSHELRTPLNVIIGYQDLLLEEEFGPINDEQRETLRRVAIRSRELLDLVSATLDLSRLEAGRVTVDCTRIDLAALIEELRIQVTEAWGSRDLHFGWNVPPDLGSLRSDPTKIKVILKSLIGNAVKFTDHGTITVSVARTPDGVEFSVSDTGIGIDASAQNVIFEAFTQADSSVSSRFGGAGLGLYIVRRLLDLLGGNVRVESELGRGATFRVLVPDLREAPDESPAVPPSHLSLRL